MKSNIFITDNDKGWLLMAHPCSNINDDLLMPSIFWMVKDLIQKYNAPHNSGLRLRTKEFEIPSEGDKEKSKMEKFILDNGEEIYDVKMVLKKFRFNFLTKILPLSVIKLFPDFFWKEEKIP